MASKRSRLEKIAKSKLLNRQLRNVFYSTRTDNTLLHHALGVGPKIYLQLQDSDLVEVLCRRDSIGYGISINSESLTELTVDKAWQKISNETKWKNKVNSEIVDVQYFFKKYVVLDSSNGRKNLVEIPTILEIKFENEEKIWISVQELNKNNNYPEIAGMVIFQDQEAVEKYTSFELEDVRNEKRESSLPLYEQFTFQGFLAVCAWAGAYAFYAIQGVFILDQINLIRVENYWQTSLIIYFVLWIVCFLTLCLIPKLRGEK